MADLKFARPDGPAIVHAEDDPEVRIMRRHHVAALASKFQNQVRKILADMHQCPVDRVILNLGLEDQLRLMNLKVWSLRYKVSIRFILGHLLPIYQKRFRGRRTPSLGIPVRMLIGHPAQEMLERIIRQEFPNGENISEWRQREQERIRHLVMPPTIAAVLAGEDPDQYVQAYRTRADKERRTWQRLKERFEKIPYLDNPWR